MAAKLVLFLLVLAFVLSVVAIVSFKYLQRRAELEHEKDMAEMEQTEKLLERD